MDRRPNFVVLLTDDQGLGDLGCYGADDLETPNLDRLAASGTRCTQWYSNAPLCSPSRASLITGRYPVQAGVPDNIGPGRDDRGVTRDVPTLPELLRDAGYQTRMVGKWHLGQWAGERPHERGFDDFKGFLHGCVDYWSHVFYWLMAGGQAPPRHDLWHNDTELHRDGEYLTHILADCAVEALREMYADDRPFLLYVPFNAPHYPMQAPKATLDRFAHLDTARQHTAALLFEYDAAVGRILDELGALGLSDDTVIFSSADHGPSRETRNWPDGREEPYPGGSTGGLRGSKATLYEGGIRLPTIWRWPGVTSPGSVYHGIGAHMDVLPTLLTAAGVDPSSLAQLDLDGIDHCTALASNDPADSPHAESPLVWRFRSLSAIRRGDWKLVTQEPPDAPVSSELYHLPTDRAEREDRRSEEPDVAAALATLLDGRCDNC
ncbi:MAG: sulfatase-like hydrolase/transferase [Planctomycetota bacterium]